MKILVGYNVANDLNNLLKLVKNEALVHSASVTLLYVNDIQPQNEEDMKKIKKSENQLKKAEQQLKQENVDCFSRVENSLSPGDTLVTIAKNENFDRIIIGVRKRSRIGKFIMGSTGQFVILEAPCPVLSINV